MPITLRTIIPAIAVALGLCSGFCPSARACEAQLVRGAYQGREDGRVGQRAHLLVQELPGSCGRFFALLIRERIAGRPWKAEALEIAERPGAGTHFVQSLQAAPAQGVRKFVLKWNGNGEFVLQRAEDLEERGQNSWSQITFKGTRSSYQWMATRIGEFVQSSGASRLVIGEDMDVGSNSRWATVGGRGDQAGTYRVNEGFGFWDFLQILESDDSGGLSAADEISYIGTRVRSNGISWMVLLSGEFFEKSMIYKERR